MGIEVEGDGRPPRAYYKIDRKGLARTSRDLSKWATVPILPGLVFSGLFLVIWFVGTGLDPSSLWAVMPYLTVPGILLLAGSILLVAASIPRIAACACDANGRLETLGSRWRRSGYRDLWRHHPGSDDIPNVAS